ncbi:MAG: hypothetical protein IT365_05470 [Candidatus Hydrogenedentes bacterium]|nr:hypothetical protein [Candidatus Hydrogenedentota bacterium]
MVKEVGEAVANCTPPHVFGIHGDWGCGKTSFLCQLHLYLSGECPSTGTQLEYGRSLAAKLWEGWNPKDKVAVIWYEAWRYQHEAVPIVALLHEIRQQLDWWARAKSAGGKLLDVSVRSALRGVAGVTKALGGEALDPDKIAEHGKAYERDRFAEALPSDAIREQLEFELGRVLKLGREDSGGNRRLVVLIDDLDRCEPEAAFRLLEGIKIYLTLKNCVFVLAMDHSVICDHVAARSCGKGPETNDEETKRIRARAKDYVEKICKDVWHLPIIADQAGLLAVYLRDKIKVRAELAEIICQVVKDHPCLPANPRKIKAFANLLVRYLVYWRVNPMEGNDTLVKQQAQLIVAMAYLYQFHHDLYRRIEGDPKFYGEILRWASGDEALAKAEVFKDLEGTHQKDTAGGTEFRPTFPDPVIGNVLRAQELIQSIGDVPKDLIRRYLLDQPRTESDGGKKPTKRQRSE